MLLGYEEANDKLIFAADLRRKTLIVWSGI